MSFVFYIIDGTIVESVAADDNKSLQLKTATTSYDVTISDAGDLNVKLETY